MSSPQGASPKKDFQGLRRSGQAAGVTLSIGRTVGGWRDGLAGWLVRLGVTPNSLTIVGFLLSLVGSAFLALSAGTTLPINPFAPEETPRSWLPPLAVVWYFLSAACDMLDGAVARVGGLHTEFGAVLDSTLDRISDTAVWCGCVVYFAGHGNVTYSFLAIASLSNAYMISYIKARAEDIIRTAAVGLNEAKPLLIVKPLHLPRSHRESSCGYATTLLPAGPTAARQSAKAWCGNKD